MVDGASVVDTARGVKEVVGVVDVDGVNAGVEDVVGTGVEDVGTTVVDGRTGVVEVDGAASTVGVVEGVTATGVELGVDTAAGDDAFEWKSAWR